MWREEEISSTAYPKEREEGSKSSFAYQSSILSACPFCRDTAAPVTLNPSFAAIPGTWTEPKGFLNQREKERNIWSN
jgi:hypothetical protein